VSQERVLNHLIPWLGALGVYLVCVRLPAYGACAIAAAALLQGIAVENKISSLSEMKANKQ
jgi:NhaP-type Na+/H+ or K+/H+ antiporter